MKKFWILGIAISVTAINSQADAQQYAQQRYNTRDARLVNYQDEMPGIDLEPERATSTSQRVSQQLKEEYHQNQMAPAGPMLAPPMGSMQQMPSPVYGQPMGNDCGCNSSGPAYVDGGGDCGCGGAADCGCGAGNSFNGNMMPRGRRNGGGCDTGCGVGMGRHGRYINGSGDRFIDDGCGYGSSGGGYEDMGYVDGGYGQHGYGPNDCGDVGYGGGYGRQGRAGRGGYAGSGYGAGYGRGGYGAGGYGAAGGLGLLSRGCDTYTVVGGGWLSMKRDGADFQPLSYETGMPTNQLLVSDANIPAQNGFEAFFARQSNDGRGWEMRYWGLSERTNSATMTNAPLTEFGGLSTITVGTYGTAWALYNSADSHTISRESDFHNAEFNFLRYASSCGARGNMVFRGIGGLRVIRFNDSLAYSAYSASSFGASGFDSLRLHSTVANTMIAAQVGGTGEYCLSDRLRFALGSKVGIGGNSMDLDQCLVTSNGIFGRNAAGNDYSYMNSETDFAMFGEFNTNMYYHISDSCRLSVGYRLFGISGVALAQDQLPYDFTDVNEINSINRDGGLLMHGLTLGAEFCR